MLVKTVLLLHNGQEECGMGAVVGFVSLKEAARGDREGMTFELLTEEKRER